MEESGNSVGILFSGQNESCCSRTQIAKQTSLKVTFALIKSVQWRKGERLLTIPLRILKMAFIKHLRIDAPESMWTSEPAHSCLFYTKGPTELLIENPVMHCPSTYKVLCLNTSHILAGHDVGTILPPVIHCSLSQARICWPRDKSPLFFPFFKKFVLECS